jgi:tetratricopeptide (TPR) repeat protein
MSLGRVGAYRIVSELGRGGLGAVYRGVDRAGNAVAIKCLIPSESSHADTRLLQESSLRIEHPNVVRTLGGGLAQDGRPYLVLELLEGVTLREAFVGASQRDRIAWLRQAALGIAAVHAHGLVHRDVKPENLFLCRDGTVKVLDLGIAAWRDERQRLTATGAVIGTPAYLSPEQARGQRLLDPRIDVWALGVVLYEALAGQPPFRRDGLLSTLLAVAIDPLVPLDEAVPLVSPQLAAVVHRCLDRNLERRLPTATALAEALERILAEPEEVAPLVSARPSELLKERSLSLLLSRPHDRSRFEALVRQAEGEPIFFADGRAIAVFGGQVSRGDEAARALATARELVVGGGAVAIALGRGAVEGGGARGAVVHEAEEALARAPSGIVCGPKAAQALRRTADLQEIAPGLFQVGEPGPRATTITPLLSRDVELAMLRRARDAALEESRPVVTWIIGSPGTGKTRLAESVRSLAAEAQPPTAIREAHARTASPGALSLFHRAFDIELRRPSGDALDATVLVDLLREASIEHIVRIADQGPLTVILEDVQWADPLSIAFLAPLLRALEGRAVWLVITGRPELLERIGDTLDTSVRIEPAPLGARDAVEMARARGLPPLSLRAAQALVAHTGGNPLFLELILDAYGLGQEGAAGRALEGNESWEDRPLPPTVEYAVQARLDQLGEDERKALSCLALFGRAADAQELLELGVSDPEPSLEQLASRDLVSRGTSPTGRTYRVRSPVVATVAAALPSPAERRVLHRRAAVVAEQRGRDFEEIAEHREAAGETEAAAEAFLQAALGAVRGGDARKVLRCGARALSCGLPVASNFALHAARIDAARWVGDHEGLARALDDGDAAAENDGQRALVESERGDWLRRGGDPAAALIHFDRAVALAEATGELNILVRATCRRAIASVTLGRLDEASVALSRLTLEAGSLSPATEGLLEDTRGFLAGSTGDLGLRRASFARAASLYTTSGDLRRAAGAESNVADAANRLGQYAEAESALRRAIELARRVGNRLTEGYALANLGYALTAQGRLPQAIDVLGEAVSIARSVGERHLLAAAQLYLCRADTSSASERVLTELASPQHSAVVRAGALALSARRALARGEVNAATERALSALTLRDEAGELEEGEAEIFVAAITALDAAGRSIEAKALVQRSQARLEELAARIADPVARSLFLERIPEHRQLLDRS